MLDDEEGLLADGARPQRAPVGGGGGGDGPPLAHQSSLSSSARLGRRLSLRRPLAPFSKQAATGHCRGHAHAIRDSSHPTLCADQAISVCPAAK